jgi:hypothetical protein
MAHLYGMSIETNSGRSGPQSADRRQPFRRVAVFTALCLILLFGSFGIHELPAVYGAASTKLAIDAFTLNGNPIGTWITIQSRGSTIASGSTPLIFQGSPGTSYSVTAHDSPTDSDMLFDHWNDGSKDRVKVVKLKKNTVTKLAAFYADTTTFSTTPAPASPSTYDLAVGSSDMAGNTMTGFKVSVGISDGVTSSLQEKTTPFTLTGTAGTSYALEPADGNGENNNSNMVFDHWEDGSTQRTRTIVLDSSVSLTAHYRQLLPPPAPSTHILTVASADMSGNVKTGMYTTIKEGGATIKFGFTPLSFTGNAGATYSVTVADYGSSFFDHWDNGSTTRTRTLTLGSDTVVIAFYRTPTLSLNPTSGPAGTSIYVTGIHFYPNSSVVVTYGDEQKSVASATTNSVGAFVVSFAAPALGTGIHSVSVTDAKGWKATATFEETATTVTAKTTTPETSPDPIAVPSHHIYVPAYWGTWKQSLVDEWDELIKSVKENPKIKFVVTINPASGSGTSQNALLASKAQALKEAGATVIGYVGVNYFSELPKSQYPVGNSWPSDTPKTMSDLKKDVDRYIAFYPMIDGFMFDDYPSKKTITLPDGTIKEVYSLAQDLDKYARSKPGITFIKANPGTAAHPDYFTLNDNMSTYEGSSLPTLSRLDTITENGKYSSKTTVVVHSLLTLPDSRTIQSLYEKVDYLYITDNSYNALPSYWQIFLERVSNPG